jgi:PAS domain S-box-containing protein
MVEAPLYNTRVIKSFTEYMSKYYPQVDLTAILDYAGIATYQLEDEGHWLTQTQVDRFYEITVKATGDANIARTVGRYAPLAKAGGGIAKYLLWYITPSSVYSLLGKLYPHVSRGSIIEVRKVGSNHAEIIAIQAPGVHEKPYQCENRLGTFEGIAKLFTNELAKIKHNTCMHTSGDRCIYNIKWKTMPSFIWKRIANYTYLLAFIICPLLFLFLPISQSLLSVSFVVFVAISITLYQVILEKNELFRTIKNHRDTADSLLDEINVRYNNSMLVQELGQAVSNILSIDLLLNYTMESIKKHLNFDRGLILLANRQRTRLIYGAGYGYNADEENLLKSTEFHLDNPRSRGPFIISFKEQKTFLIDDFSKLEKIISQRSYEFALKMGVKSFISVPIIYEGISEGVLAVDNYHSKRSLNQSDISLFMGIASQLGISINNAKSYELIREREQRFRALSENAPDIIYTLDLDGRFIYVNPAWEKILGYREDDVIGKLFTDFLKTADIERFNLVFDYIKDSRETVIDFYVPIVHKDGTERLFHMSGAPDVDSSGNVFDVVGVFKDITELKKSEIELREMNNNLIHEMEERKTAEAKRTELERQLQQAQKLEAIGTLAGGIAHDFNNLLMGIQGHATLIMLDKSINHNHYEKLKNIENYVDRGSDLTRQLLGFAREGKYEAIPININELIKTSSRMFGRTKKNISISTSFDPTLWTVEVDQGQIEQVLLNLYLNAADAMPEGGDVYIETKNVSITENEAQQNKTFDSGRYVRILVKDTGIGIDEKSKPRIFEPFFTTKARGRGTGLGLASAYGIIKSHGGFITVNSEVGQGTEFIIHLPASEKVAKKEAAISENLIMGKETLLVVDDENDILDLFAAMLTELGYNVILAASGREAVKKLAEKKDKIDLVILDMVMPETSGYETFKLLKQIKPGLKILFSSGYSFPQEALQILNGGQGNFIQKPFDIQKLSTKLREILTTD